MNIWTQGESMFRYMHRHLLSDITFDFDHVEEIKRRVKKWTKNFRYTIEVKYGISRIVFIFPDYVIKVVLGKGNENDYEIELYQQAFSDGYDYLFAEVHQRCVDGIKINIMPRIPNIDINGPDLFCSNYIDDDEKWWLDVHVTDLHAGNYGFDSHGNVKIFDYAMVYSEEEEEEDEEAK